MKENKIFTNLSEIKKNIHLELSFAQHDKNKREITLSTSVKNIPSSRIVILRKFSPDYTIQIFTDARSSKIREMKSNNFVPLLYYNKFEKIQIRMNGKVAILKKKTSWKNFSEFSKLNYNTILAPGSKLSNKKFQYNKDIDKGLENFLVCRITIEEIDWLKLIYPKSIRAKFFVMRNEKKAKLNGSLLVP